MKNSRLTRSDTVKKETAIRIICSLLILLFAYAGLSKLLNHDFFHAQLLLFPVLKYAEPVLSRLLPIVELIVVIFLIIPRICLVGLLASFILLVLFTVYLIVMVMVHVKLPCSCGGVISYLTWKQHIVFNLFFLLVSFAGIKLQRKVLRQSFPGIIGLPFLS